MRQRYLDRLTRELLNGAAPDVLVAAAERAAWTPPETLTAVLTAHGHKLPPLDPRTLRLVDDLPGLTGAEDLTALLIPDLNERTRRDLIARFGDRPLAVVGPVRPWCAVASSFDRARRALRLALGDAGAPVDTDDHLTEVVLRSDPEALTDLRDRVLAPLAGLRAGSRNRLTETLRAWLLHQGRRDDIAAALFVHPQTVRYRLNQLRDLFGDRLGDPRQVLELTIALGCPH
ncbi:PucR family transcriptional regulator [Rhodococcus sp. MSC1_016]|uniref:PucR family transcriptional regulator n=1 Tax=Rhodococcus sp. MSC1_016 TaxID=2909266 RepID=UPI00202E47DA|nr:helix-turn-helix domain-containing protein [Rhodococcus sp. MSC1_016]